MIASFGDNGNSGFEIDIDIDSNGNNLSNKNVGNLSMIGEQKEDGMCNFSGVCLFYCI